MKEFLLCLTALLVYVTPSCATDIRVTNSAEQIYDNCQTKFALQTQTNSIQGNISDVKRELNIRHCLKTELLETAKTFIAPDEIDNLKQNLDNIEQSSFEIYRILIFCNNGNSDNWCREEYVNDTSLGKLLLEKSITSEIYNLLKSTIDSKEGSFNF